MEASSELEGEALLGGREINFVKGGHASYPYLLHVLFHIVKKGVSGM